MKHINSYKTLSLQRHMYLNIVQERYKAADMPNQIDGKTKDEEVSLIELSKK